MVAPAPVTNQPFAYILDQLFVNPVQNEVTDDDVTYVIQRASGSDACMNLLRALRGKFAYQAAHALDGWLGRNPEHRLFPQAIRVQVKLSAAQGANIEDWSFLRINGVTLPHKDPIAEGAFAHIYRGFYGNTPVAVKRPKKNNTAGAETRVRKQLCREAVAWRHLDHPHVLSFVGLTIIDFGTHKDVVPNTLPCMVMPWCPNGNVVEYLEKFLEENEQTPAKINQERERMLVGVTKGLKYLHSSGIVHGDLHGGNILVDENNNAVLGDFGLVGIVDLHRRGLMTSTNESGGTRYQAPELLIVEDDEFYRTFASDIYAYGSLCLEIYTGKGQYPNIKRKHALIQKITTNAERTPPSTKDCHGVDMLKICWELVLRCLSFNPVDRPHIHHILDVLCVLKFYSTADSRVVKRYLFKATVAQDHMHVPNSSGKFSFTGGDTIDVLEAQQDGKYVVQNSAGEKGLIQADALQEPLPFRARSRWDHRAQKQTELQLSEGEIVDILRVSTTWWVARKQNGIIGEVQADYLELLADNLIGEAEAMYSYETPDDLPHRWKSFASGDKFNAGPAIGDWQLVRKRGRIELGVVPACFLKLS